MPLTKVGKPSLMADQLGEEGRPSGLATLLLELEQYLFNRILAQLASFS